MTKFFTVPGSAYVTVNDDGSCSISFTGQYTPSPETSAPPAEASLADSHDASHADVPPVAASSSTESGAAVVAFGPQSDQEYSTVAPLPPALTVEEPAAETPAEGDGTAHTDQR